MRRFFLILGLLAALPMHAQTSPLLTSIRQIRQLTPDEAEQGAPVQIEGVVTFYEPAEHILFIEDSTGPIFIRTRSLYSFLKGDRISVRGKTAGSYRTVVASEDMHVVGSGKLPLPHPATFPQLISGSMDCAYVTVAGTVLSATMQQTAGAPFALLEFRMDGGSIDVHVEAPQSLDLRHLLDSQVVLTGVSGGRFDGKLQLIGTMIYLSSPADLRVVSSALTDPSELPASPIDRIMGSYNVLERSPRLRVRGSVTLYEPGFQLVLQDGENAVLVHTHQHSALAMGEVAYATGFASANDYSQSLIHGEFLPTGVIATVQAKPVDWEDAVMGKRAFELVSLEGRLIEQVHEPNQDTLFINSRGHVFSTILRHPGQSGTQIPALRIGSYVRASGVCFVMSGGPWRGALEFELHMRDARDLEVLAGPPWWTVAHMVYVIGALALVIFAALAWGTVLRRRVRQQTRLIRHAMQEEAARVRRRAALEKDRSRVLEAINNRAPLPQVLRMIGDLISQQAEGFECWCELIEDSREVRPVASKGPHHCRQEIVSGTGERLGSIVLVWSADQEPGSAFDEVLERGANLAALAIDNRRLYDHLVRRSEYDQLTDVPNRFLLESCLKEAFATARENGRSFALIFIDLDRFKFVNDRYGHRTGDMYLQTVARRLAENLREQDTLARVGGDEFIVLIPEVRDRGEAEEIALRIEGCFATPFRIDGHSIQGSASIGVALYPQDGTDEDQLKRSADFAMYVSKQGVIEWE